MSELSLEQIGKFDWFIRNGRIGPALLARYNGAQGLSIIIDRCIFRPLARRGVDWVCLVVPGHSTMPFMVTELYRYMPDRRLTKEELDVINGVFAIPAQT